MKKIFLNSLLLNLFCAEGAFASLSSIRLKGSIPSTIHDLFYDSKNPLNPNTEFLLSPKNNERLGLFLIYKGTEIGFSVDPIKNDVETDTIDLELIKNFKNKHRVGLRFQRLDGLEVEAKASGIPREEAFLYDLSCMRIELFSISEIWSNSSQTYFKSYFMNRLKEKTDKKLFYSVIVRTIARYLKIDQAGGVVFQPSFFNAPIENTDEVEALAFYSSIGVLGSYKVYESFAFHLESSLGGGYFDRLGSDNDQFKSSGFDHILNFGLGFSWDNQKQLVNIRLG